MKEELTQVQSWADKAQRGQMLALSSIQQDTQTVYEYLQLLHQDLERSGSQDTRSLARTQDAVAPLAAGTWEAIKRNRQAIAGAIATVEERMTIAHLKIQ